MLMGYVLSYLSISLHPVLPWLLWRSRSASAAAAARPLLDRPIIGVYYSYYDDLSSLFFLLFLSLEAVMEVMPPLQALRSPRVWWIRKRGRSRPLMWGVLYTPCGGLTTHLVLA
jgi:hypothetical protein